MLIKIPSQNVTISIHSRKMGVINHETNTGSFEDVSKELAYITSIASAVAGAAAFSALTSVGVPPVVTAGCLAASRPLVGVDGYYRDDGTYVRGHNRTHPDCIEANNFSA